MNDTTYSAYTLIMSTYTKRRKASLAACIPIQFADIVRQGLKTDGIKAKFRYRGPRVEQTGIQTTAKGTYDRDFHMASMEGLKSHATHFTVYPV